MSAFRLVRFRGIALVFCGHLHLVTLAMVIARLTGAKLIVQMHGIEAWQRPSPMRRIAVEHADLVLCVSRYTRAAVLGWTAIAPERVIVLPNTYHEYFTPGDASELRTELGCNGKQVLLTVGRMDSQERYKGHDRVIAAIPQLIAHGHDIVYIIVGDGDDRSRLESLAAAAGVAGRVKFLGNLEWSRLVLAYRMADLFVMPSIGEGFGIAFLEAMACNTPVLGLKVAGAMDALADGELGDLVTEEELPAAVSRLLTRSWSDSRLLSACVQQRFGREAFSLNAHAAVRRLFSESSISLDQNPS